MFLILFLVVFGAWLAISEVILRHSIPSINLELQKFVEVTMVVIPENAILITSPKGKTLIWHITEQSS